MVQALAFYEWRCTVLRHGTISLPLSLKMSPHNPFLWSIKISLLSLSQLSSQGRVKIGNCYVLLFQYIDEWHWMLKRYGLLMFPSFSYTAIRCFLLFSASWLLKWCHNKAVSSCFDAIDQS